MTTLLSLPSDLILNILARRRTRRSSRCVFLLDCRTYQWSRLKNMHVGRQSLAVEVIDGKVYVIGGCLYKQDKDWGEVYDPKTQTWELLLPTTLDLTTRKSIVPGKLVIGGKVYDLYHGFVCLEPLNTIYLVETEKDVFCQISLSDGKLTWRDTKGDLGWSEVMGLEKLPYKTHASSYFVSMRRGRMVTVWSETWEIGCNEILSERRGFKELWGFVEWSKSEFYIRPGSDSDFFLHSALVTH